MSESRSLPEKESRLPTVISAFSTPTTNTDSTTVSKRAGFISILAALTPLAVEVIYGLTRKWLYETTSSGAVSRTSANRDAVNSQPARVRRSTGVAGYRRRCRGSQI